jgi:sulfhydrogenase subunit beta (sulfur reductase)
VEADVRVLDVDGLAALITALRDDGRAVIGPVVREGVIVYDEIDSLSDLPAGVTDEQGPGRYALASRPDGALFGYAVGPHSWKRTLFPPRERLWRAERSDHGFRLVPEEPVARPVAFLGVRPCELAAMDVHDRVFASPQLGDPGYLRRRADAFVVAVQCASPAATCFCASMGTGPTASTGYDVSLTELTDGEHRFVAAAGTDEGRALLGRLPTTAAAPADLEACAAQAERSAVQARAVDTGGLPAVLLRRIESSHWDDVASRCLACANCTMVCPTCFCHTVEDHTDLTGDHAERWRRWDSCFTEAFSYIHGGSVRSSTKSRYRQWLTHKLGTWTEQFGVQGCVGCGRCITWCPVGIDLTHEVHTLRELDLAVSASRQGR